MNHNIDPIYSQSAKISITQAVLNPILLKPSENRMEYYPSECRIRGKTYAVNLHVELAFEIDDQLTKEIYYSSRIFPIPLMVKCKLCNLNDMTPTALQEFKEDENDPGGYFIINGKEHLLRNFLILRRNYPLAVEQPKYKTLQKLFTEFGIFVRSVKDEHTQSEVILHYLSDGSMELRLVYKRSSYYLSLMLLLKALVDETDYFIVKQIVHCEDDISLKHSLVMMLQSYSVAGICSHQQAKSYIGEKFAAVANLPEGTSADQIADHIFQNSLLIHLKSNNEKFKLLCLMTRKLFALCKGHCKAEDPNNIVYQEILTSGHIYLMTLKDELMKFLYSVGRCFDKEIQKNEFSIKHFLSLARKSTNRAHSIAFPMSTMIATGNVSCHGFKSSTGFSILCDRLNVLRFLSHFTCLNKFTMKFYAKNMRRFYPESWGFFCPVQTPEGSLTSLQNHMAIQCKIVSPGISCNTKKLLFDLGCVLPYNDVFAHCKKETYCVLLNGEVVGWVIDSFAKNFVEMLKWYRSTPESVVPLHTEIVFVTRRETQFLYPGVFIFSTPCRLVRSTKYLDIDQLLGTFEQQFSSVSIPDGSKIFPHAELDHTSFLGVLASCNPFFENNPATRNTFSCMKIQQAIGIPFTNLKFQQYSKRQQLIYPQSPIVTTRTSEEFGLDNYPVGTNLVIAVISYSGFDMEDAVVFNQASIERGLMQDLVYKAISFDIAKVAEESNSEITNLSFKRDDDDFEIKQYLDEDGLPYVGGKINAGDPICSIWNEKLDTYLVKFYDGKQTSSITSVDLQHCQQSSVSRSSHKVVIRICYKRIPEVGDKFANRHGQKGISSALWQPEDMPFTADGIVPDILFNPHGLPSRMSIGMMLEILSCKIASLKAFKYSHNAFQHSTGKELMSFLGGYDFYGTEKLFSGISGNELEADIFVGVMYYVRLRHLVEEKYQVCSIGQKDEVTGQPQQASGSGAVRFGEMERDSLLSHGTAFLVLDRLHLCSDACQAWVCAGCSCLLYPIPQNGFDKPNHNEKNDVCRNCGPLAQVFLVTIPYVFVYLLAELAAVNIKVKLTRR